MRKSIGVLMVFVLLVFSTSAWAWFEGNLPYESYLAIGGGSDPLDGNIIDEAYSRGRERYVDYYGPGALYPGDQVSSQYELMAGGRYQNLRSVAVLNLDSYEPGEESFEHHDSAWSVASFRQQYRVTGAGPASIDFEFYGYLSVFGGETGSDSNSYEWWIDGRAVSDVSVYVDGYFVEPIDIWNERDWDNVEFYGDEEFYIDERPSLTFNFEDEDVGQILAVEVILMTKVEGSLSFQYWGDGESGEGDDWQLENYAYLTMTSDFVDAKITSVNGGLETVTAVPVPGSIFLFGGGICILVILRRNFTKV